MTTRITTLILLFGLLAGCAGLGRDFDTPRVDLASFEPVAGATGIPRFLIGLRIVNPNDRALNIKGVYFDLSIEGHEVFSGASNEASVIPAYGEGIVALDAAPGLFGAITLFNDLIDQRAAGDALHYDLFAKISLGGQPMPLRIHHRGEFNVKQPAQ